MYQQIRRAFVASALALFCFAAYAQQTVKGTVKDANGEPMIGVTIATGVTLPFRMPLLQQS